MSDKPPAQVVSDDELLEAVRQVCEKRGLPVAPTSLIAEVDGINIKQQTVKRRLDKIDRRINSISVGRGKVWWVPEDTDPVGDVDISAVDWSVIDPGEIPAEKVQEHPEFNIPDYWESWEERANAVVSTAFLPTIAGFIVFALQDANVPFLEIGQNAAAFGALVAMAGVVFILVGILIGVSAKIGGYLASYGVDDYLEKAKRRTREEVSDRVPLSISWEK